MKHVFLSILSFMVINAPYVKSGNTVILPIYDKVIIPVSADKLQDEVIGTDVISIFNGKSNDNLYEHKAKGKGQLIITRYKPNGWSFYVGFSEKIQKKKGKSDFDIYCPPEKNFVEDIKFFHVKYMLGFTANSLSVINKEILSVFGGHHVNCTVKSYISKDRYANYLHLNVEDGEKKLEYVLVIKSSEFYQCVRKTNTAT